MFHFFPSFSQVLPENFLELPIFLLNLVRINSIPLSGGMFIQLRLENIPDSFAVEIGEFL